MDTKTLTFTMMLVAGALALVTVILALYRREKHLTIYAAGFVTAMFSFLLFMGQGTFSSWLSVIAANLLLLFFYLSLAWGLRTWAEIPRTWPGRFNVYILVWLGVLLPATYLWDSYLARATVSSVLIVVVTGEFLFAVSRTKREVSTVIHRAAWLIGLGLIACHVIRIGLLWLPQNAEASLLSNNVVSSFTFIFTIFFSILWTGLILITDAASLVKELSLKNEVLEALATTDKLTGLSNRHLLETTILSEMDRSLRYSQPLSLVMLDLDHFKRVNDTWGHETGDLVLKTTASRILSSIRGPDSVFRWGGEEFVILLPHTNLEGGCILAEKIRQTIEAEPFPTVGPVTASFGVAEWKPQESREHWFKQVDQALYRAKNGGRNQVVRWNSEDTLPIALVKLEWRTEWESGNTGIDNQHRRLLEIANGLLDHSLTSQNKAVLTGLFQELLDDVLQHFAEEERVLQTVKYPEAEHHAELHRQLVTEAVVLRDQFLKGETDATSFFNYLVGKVVIGHLLTADVKFFPYTRADSRASTSRS